MKKFCLFILLSLCFATVYAGFDLRTAIPLVETKTLPVDFSKDLSFRANHSLENPNNAIPDKIYENFQLTDFFNARDNIDMTLLIRISRILQHNFVKDLSEMVDKEIFPNHS